MKNKGEGRKKVEVKSKLTNPIDIKKENSPTTRRTRDKKQ